MLISCWVCLHMVLSLRLVQSPHLVVEIEVSIGRALPDGCGLTDDLCASSSVACEERVSTLYVSVLRVYGSFAEVGSVHRRVQMQVDWFAPGLPTNPDQGQPASTYRLSPEPELRFLNSGTFKVA